MYDIQEKALYSGVIPPSNSFVNDIADSYAENQIQRLIHRPLITKNNENTSFSSWRGRVVCFVKFCHNLIREPFRLFKNILVVMITAQMAFLEIINAPFCESARKDLFVLIAAPIKSSAGILIRPFGFCVDELQLACGAFIHPALAISHTPH